MTVQTSWDDNEKTIVHVDFIGHWTWQEAHQAIDTMIALIESVDHRVHIIIDMHGGSHVPPLAFGEVRSLLSKRHPRAGVTVILGANFMLASLWKTMAQTYGRLIGNNRYIFADTLEEALARIAESAHPRR